MDCDADPSLSTFEIVLGPKGEEVSSVIRAEDYTVWVFVSSDEEGLGRGGEVLGCHIVYGEG